MTKTYTEQIITGQKGINLVEKLVLQMGWVWNATNIEAGIDGYIEIRDPSTGRATNIILQVQSKALSHLPGESTDAFDYVCSPKDLEYWLSGNAPVVLVVSRPSTEEAYWVSIKDYFNTAARRRERRIVFDKRRDTFDVDARDRLQQLAMPKNLGIYLTPPPRQEPLYANLLAIESIPTSMYRANTNLRDGREIRKALGYADDAPDDWFYRSKQVISPEPFDSLAWQSVIDAGTVEEFNLSEWALSTEREKVNEFVEFMFHALKAKLRPLRVRYHRDGEYFYFAATPDLSTRRIEYRGFRKTSTRTVFQGFPSKEDPKQMRFYRHAAFAYQFFRFDSKWYVAITPTYHFTHDGWRQHKWYESKLKGIKGLEKNPAVLGQVAFWAAMLRDEGVGLFQQAENSPLRFGELVSLAIEAGINETLWLWSEEDDDTKRAHSELPFLSGDVAEKP